MLDFNLIPDKGSVTIHGNEYQWVKQKDGFGMLITIFDYGDYHTSLEAMVYFPNQMIDIDNPDEWDASVAEIDHDGGDHDRQGYIDQYEYFFDWLEKVYSTANK